MQSCYLKNERNNYLKTALVSWQALRVNTTYLNWIVCLICATSGQSVETAGLLLFLYLLKGSVFLSQQMEPSTFSSIQEGRLRRKANHWWASNSKQKGGRAKWSSLEGKPRWTPGGRAEHSYSDSGVRKLRASTHDELLRNCIAQTHNPCYTESHSRDACLSLVWHSCSSESLVLPRGWGSEGNPSFLPAAPHVSQDCHKRDLG